MWELKTFLLNLLKIGTVRILSDKRRITCAEDQLADAKSDLAPPSRPSTGTFGWAHADLMSLAASAPRRYREPDQFQRFDGEPVMMNPSIVAAS